MTTQFSRDSHRARSKASWSIGRWILMMMTVPLFIEAQYAFAQLERGWSLDVLVSDHEQRPVSEAVVELVFIDASRVLEQGETDDRGRATLSIPTRKPVELGGLNLFLYIEADRYAPELQRLNGSPDRMFVVELERSADREWARRTGRVLRSMMDSGAELIDVLLPATGSTSMPAAPLVTGDPCDALPTGMNQCITCSGLAMPTVVVGGRVAFGRYKGRTRQELDRMCGSAAY